MGRMPGLLDGILNVPGAQEVADDVIDNISKQRVPLVKPEERCRDGTVRPFEEYQVKQRFDTTVVPQR